MPESPSASDWAAARGERWRAQLGGMEAMLAPVDEPLIGALHLDAPYAIAEVGCGGGGTAREILRRAPAGSVVHGFDILPALIEVARVRTSCDERVVFQVADMGIAPAPAEPYDRLVSRFGIMFFDDPPAAFANLARWLSPGGRFAFASWARLAENPWMATVREVVAEVVDVPSLDPEAPGPFRYADAGKLLSLLARAGFGPVDVRDWRGALPVAGGLCAAESAHFALAAFSSFSELLTRAGDAAIHEAHRRLTERLSRHEEGGVVRLGACVHLFTGAKTR